MASKPPPHKHQLWMFKGGGVMTVTSLNAGQDQRPTIDVTDLDIPRLVRATSDALEGASLQLYQRGNQLVEAVTTLPGVSSSKAQTAIVALKRARLRELAGMAARWVRVTQDGVKPVLPPQYVVDAILERSSWPFPSLLGIVDSPVLRPDGSILDQIGYDSATGLIYDPGDSQFQAIPRTPSRDDAYHALEILSEPLDDFPFANSWDRSAAVSAILTTVARYAIAGPTPLFAIDAPVQGTGKSLLVDVVSTIVTGSEAVRCVWTNDDEELRKRVLATLLAGSRLVLLDNIDRPLRSAVLAAVLTARHFSDRILGRTQTVTAPALATWFGTGNNLQFFGDFARRVVPVCLDPQTEIPEERSHFKHPQLLKWVKERRSVLLPSALTILQAFDVAGRPQIPGVRPYGSYEDWSQLVRAALLWLDQPDPLDGRIKIREEANPEKETLRVALHAWHSALADHPHTVKRVKAMFEGGLVEKQGLRDLHEALSDLAGDGSRVNWSKLSYGLRKFRGRIVDGYSFEQSSRTQAGVEWFVLKRHRVVEPSNNVDRADGVDGLLRSEVVQNGLPVEEKNLHHLHRQYEEVETHVD